MSICDDVIAHSKSHGADECEAVFCSKKTITIRITDSEIAEIKENNDRSIGVRLVHSKKISAAHSTSLDAAKTVDAALRSSRFLAERPFWESFPPESGTYHTVKSTNDARLWDLDSASAADIAQEMINSALHRKVADISGSLNIVCEEFEVKNTSGLEKREEATYIAGMINADSEAGTAQVSGIGQANSRMLAGFDAGSVGREASQMCADSLNPLGSGSDTVSVIFDPMAVGEILTFVAAPNFSLKTYSDGRSCFSGKMNSKIAADELSLMDLPHAENGLGSKSFDDEGVPTRDKQYIKNGVFSQVYSDSYNAFKEGVRTSANACRPGSPLGRSSEPIPIASPHSLTISAGSLSRDEMIKDTQRGIIVNRLWYTYAVNPIRGDFSCTARSGIWVVENGRIRHPARQVRIIHNLPKLLHGISAVANNPRTVLSWAANPVTAPTIRCDGISISQI